MMDGRTRLTILRGIEVAIHAQLDLQTRYKTIIRTLRNVQAPDHIDVTMDAVDEIMAEQDYPPSSRQLDVLGISLHRDQEISKVPDADILSLLHDLAQIRDQTARLAAAAHFWASVGAYSHALHKTFICWTEITALRAATQGGTPNLTQPVQSAQAPA